MRWLVKTVVVCLATASPGIALADDYPLVGLYSIIPDGPYAEIARENRCLTAFVSQEKNGDYTWYVADVDRLLADGTLQYQILETGRCDYNATDRVEFCEPERSAMGSEKNWSLHRKGDADDMEIVTSWQGKGASDWEMGTPSHMVRCPFQREQVKALISNNWTTLTKDLVGRIIWNDPAWTNKDFARAIRDAQGKSL
jgi:hypothetical protein